MRTRFITLVVAATLLSGCGGSAGNNAGDARPSTSASPAATTSENGPNALAGTWKFTLEGAHLTFGSGDYTGAQLTTDGYRITVSGTSSARSVFTATDPQGTVTIRCATNGCHVGLLAFKRENATTYQLVNTATFEPYKVESGASFCGAPAAPEAYVIRDFSGAAFSFVAGRTGKNGNECYQALWTIRATRVS